MLRLVHGTEHKDKVINLHEKELDNLYAGDCLDDPNRWPDYTELPEKQKEMSYQDMIDAGYEMTGEGIWWPKDKEEDVKEETPDYNNPYVCAKIDELAGDNRN